MTRAASPRLVAYAFLGAAGLVAALALGRPEPAAVAAPFLLVLVVGLGLARDPELEVAVRPARDRAVEGDEIEVEVELVARGAAHELEVLLLLPPGLEDTGGRALAALPLEQSARTTLSRRIRCRRWGAHRLGSALLRARDPLHLLVWEGAVRGSAPLRVYPAEERVRSLLAPRETQVFAGNEVARAKGDGLEFADLRPFAFGDPVRRINWRASARRSELWVNEHHPERNTDVVLFLDTFEEARRDGGGTLDLAVRAGSTLAARYLHARDRVGLVSFGGTLRWLYPGMGIAQAYRIVDALLDTDVTLSYAWKGMEVIPPGTIPPKSLVLALSPLLDSRTAAALADLGARGFDVAIVEVSPIPFDPPPRGPLEDAVARLRVLKREALRLTYERQGIPVAEWREGVPLAVPLEEVRAFRRAVRLARA